MPKRVESDGNTYHTMKVWHPERGTTNEWSIASEEGHVGNRIAEGEIPQEVFWPHMAEYYRKRSRDAEQRHAEYVWKREREWYAEHWILFWRQGHRMLDQADRETKKDE